MTNVTKGSQPYNGKWKEEVTVPQTLPSISTLLSLGQSANSEYFGNSNLGRLRDILSLPCPALRPQSLVFTDENGFLNEG